MYGDHFRVFYVDIGAPKPFIMFLNSDCPIWSDAEEFHPHKKKTKKTKKKEKQSKKENGQEIFLWPNITNNYQTILTVGFSPR